MAATTSFLCSACNINFTTDRDRREHMRGEWHVYNVKRRMESLPPISLGDYEEKITSSRAENRSEKTIPRPVSVSSETQDHEIPSPTTNSSDEDTNNNDDDDDDEDPILPSPAECLFCPTTSPSLIQNLTHMKLHHSFEIPNPGALQTDLETFISYLSVVILRYFSCLYCGQAKHSAEAVRAHMLDKGHCMLDLEAGSEFLEFWDGSVLQEGEGEGEGGGGGLLRSMMLSENEMRLPSGAVAASRHSQPRTRGLKSEGPSNELALVTKESGEAVGAEQETSSRAPPQSQALSRRDEMGVVGLSDQQRRSLMAVKKKIQAREQRQRGARMWALEKEANRQKTFKVSSRPIPPWYSGRING